MLFERDCEITGKHAEYLKYMAVKNAKDEDDKNAAASSARLFERYIDVYMNAAVWGLRYSRTAPKDTSSGNRARIYADAFATKRENCVFLYRMVMLLDKRDGIDPEERINRAFRYDTQSDKAKEEALMDVFHDYVRGGIELMYERFTEGCYTREDYLEKVFEVMTAFKQEIEDISDDDELAKLIR